MTTANPKTLEASNLHEEIYSKPNDSENDVTSNSDAKGLSSEGAERVISTIVLAAPLYRDALVEIGKVEGFTVASPNEVFAGLDQEQESSSLPSAAVELKKLKLPALSRELHEGNDQLEDLAILRNDGKVLGFDGKFKSHYPLELQTIYKLGQDPSYKTIDGDIIKMPGGILEFNSGGATLNDAVSRSNKTPEKLEHLIQVEGGNILSAPLKNGENAVLVGEGHVLATWLKAKEYGFFDKAWVEQRYSELKTSKNLTSETETRNKSLLEELNKLIPHEIVPDQPKDADTSSQKSDELKTKNDPYRFEAEIDYLKQAYGNAFDVTPQNITVVTQRAFHIDLTVRPGINGQVFVESPTLSLELIDSILSDPKNSTALDRKLQLHREIGEVLFDLPKAILEEGGEEEYFITQRQLLQLYRNRATIDTAFEIKQYPQMISRLENAGYQVVSVPGTFAALTDSDLNLHLKKYDAPVQFNGYLANNAFTSNFMNGLMGSNHGGEPYFITNSSPSELLQQGFEKILKEQGIERVYFIGGATLNFPQSNNLKGYFKEPGSATESLSNIRSGLDCQTLEISKNFPKLVLP